MFLNVFMGFLILAFISCQSHQQKISIEIVEANLNSMAPTKTEESNVTENKLVEFFSDDSKIGLPNQNKVELSEFEKSEGYLIEIKFYSLAKNKEWILKQTFEFENYDYLNCDPELKDFNNDGLKDLTYISALAGRGANELRRLFIYDKKKDELINIKNSEEYPNMLYNKDLDCIDAWRFYGDATSTDFLRIEGDSLKPFASVETIGIDRKVYLIDKNGKEKLLRKDKVEENGFDRYKNFNPLEPYK